MKVIRNGKFKRSYPLVVDPPVLYIGRGVNLRSPKLKDRRYRERGAYIYLENRNSHLIAFGRTRWGKTRFIERAVVDDIEVGNSVFIIDPKGDYELLEAVIDAVERTGRQDDFMLFSGANPEISIKINPFNGMPPDRIGDMLKSLAPVGENGEFFASVAFKLGKAVASGLYAKGEKEIKVVDILQHLDLKKIQELQDDVSEKGRDPYRGDALLSLQPLTSKDPNFWSKISSTADVLLDQLSTGVVGKLFGKAEGNPIRERILVERKPIIFYGFLPRLVLGEDIASIIAKLLSTTLIGIYGYMYANNDYFDRMFVEYIDEAKQVFHRGIEQKFNIAGGLNVSICAFTQSKGDLEEKLGKDLTKVVLDNTNWLIFSVLDSDTALEFSRASGTKKVYEPVWEEGDGRLPKLSLVPKDRPLIESSEFMRMRKGCFHAFLDGSWYRGYSDMLRDRRRIWIKPLKYPVKEIVKHFGVDRETALRMRESEEVIEKFADLVVDLRNYPYYSKYVKSGGRGPSLVPPRQATFSHSPPAHIKDTVARAEEPELEAQEEAVLTATVPSPSEADRIANEVDRKIVKYILENLEKFMEKEINVTLIGGGSRVLKQGDHLYISNIALNIFPLSRDEILRYKKMHLFHYDTIYEKHGKKWKGRGQTRGIKVNHEGVLDFIEDYPFPIKSIELKR